MLDIFIFIGIGLILAVCILLEVPAIQDFINFKHPAFFESLINLIKKVTITALGVILLLCLLPLALLLLYVRILSWGGGEIE